MNYPILTERDLELIFSEKRKRKLHPLLKGIVYLAIFALVTGIVFSVLNYKSLRKNFLFWYRTEFNDNFADKNNFISTIANSGSISGSEIPNIPDNSLSIPILEVSAPIIWQVPNREDKVAEELEKGLIQIEGTSLPGETGNVFITGHSSNYPWAKGDYKNVFALLGKLVVGDVILAKYKNVNYIYKVSEIKVVEPTEISVLKQTQDSRLTLMTCTPVGTSLRRLIVTSTQLFPDPKQNKPPQKNSDNNALPSIR